MFFNHLAVHYRGATIDAAIMAFAVLDGLDGISDAQPIWPELWRDSIRNVAKLPRSRVKATDSVLWWFTVRQRLR